jgi:hypothetical protein
VSIPASPFKAQILKKEVIIIMNKNTMIVIHAKPQEVLGLDNSLFFQTNCFGAQGGP